MLEQRYLQLLSNEYPTIAAVSSEIINLRAIMSLPKGTEYFFSDLHGEHESFIYLLKSASGVIATKIDELFEKSLSQEERILLANLIYYPEREIPRRKAGGAEEFDEWCKLTIYRLVEVCRTVSSKYTRSKVRKKLPADFAYIMDELLHVEEGDKSHYFSQIIRSIVETGVAEEFITELCTLIRQLTVDMLHIVGDVYDRGPRADAILDELMTYHDVDIQWGNHDIYWMGAAMGNWACIANAIRLGISYNNFDLLEDGYGINLRPLSSFAAKIYQEDPCTIFTPHILDENKYDPVDIHLAAKMHKAIAVIQFKLEAQLIARHPEYQMDDRALLLHVDFERGMVTVEGKEYPLRDTTFPTVDPATPWVLSQEEEELMQTISSSFLHSEVLQRHLKFLFLKGSIYKTINGNLLYHGCVPMTPDGAFDQITFGGAAYSGKSYFDLLNGMVHDAYFSPRRALADNEGADFMWYLWAGPKSPLFGKSKLSTFERYFIEDKETHKEVMNPYYSLFDRQEICEKILAEFGLDPRSSHIINGHVPVKIKQGEHPIKGGGKLFMIDGGISKAYQSKTGIGGYTLIYNSRSLALAEHHPFRVDEYGNRQGAPSTVQIVETMSRRVRVADTDNGKNLALRVRELQELLQAYREGRITEKIHQ